MQINFTCSFKQYCISMMYATIENVAKSPDHSSSMYQIKEMFPAASSELNTFSLFLYYHDYCFTMQEYFGDLKNTASLYIY